MALSSAETGPAIGSSLPARVETEEIFRSPGPVALFFVSLYCVHCVDLLPHLREIRESHGIPIVLFSNGDDDDHEEMSKYFAWDIRTVSLDKDAMEEAYEVTAFPFCIVADETRRVAAKSVVYTAEDFAFLLRRGGFL